MSAEKHTVHLKDGGRVVIEGDRCEIHLGQPLVVHRKHWIHWLAPDEEARRCMPLGTSLLEKALAEAFRTVPMTVYPEDD